MSDIQEVEFLTGTWKIPGSGMQFTDTNGVTIHNPEKTITVLTLPEFTKSFLLAIGEGLRIGDWSDDHVSYFNRRLDKLLSENYYFAGSVQPTSSRYLLRADDRVTLLSSYRSWNGNVDRITSQRVVREILLADTPRGRLGKFWELIGRGYRCNPDNVDFINEFYLQYRFALSQWYPFIPFTQEATKYVLSSDPGANILFCKHVRWLTGCGLTLAHALMRKQRAYCDWVSRPWTSAPESTAKAVETINAMNFQLYPYRNPSYVGYIEAYTKEIP